MNPSIGDLVFKYCPPQDGLPECDEAQLPMADDTYLSIKRWPKTISVALVYFGRATPLARGLSPAGLALSWLILLEQARELLAIQVDTVIFS